MSFAEDLQPQEFDEDGSNERHNGSQENEMGNEKDQRETNKILLAKIDGQQDDIIDGQNKGKKKKDCIIF